MTHPLTAWCLIAALVAFGAYCVYEDSHRSPDVVDRQFCSMHPTVCPPGWMNSKQDTFRLKP